MSWRDAIGLVRRELRRRAGRSALTVAAVALAATLLTALVTIAGTAQNRVLSEVSTGGPLAGIKVAAAQPDPSQVDQDNARPGPPKPLDDAALQRIRGLKDVQAVYPIVVVPTVVLAPERVTLAGVTAEGPSEPYGDSLVGVPLDQSSHLPVTLVAGRLPIPGSLTEIAATPDFLDRLHLSQRQAAAVIGVRVEIGFPRGFGRGASRARWFDPTVVGVVAQDAGPGQLVGSIELASIGRDWILAGGTQSAARFGFQPTTYTGLFVVADRLDKVTTVRTRITAVGYSTQAPEQLIASVKRYLRVVEIVLTGVGLIALVVAALGIANALLAAVRERRREIGVLKAIGARDRDVLRVFLIEALAVGTLGGLIGAALGTGVAAVVGLTVNQYLASQGVERLRLEVSPVVLVGAVLGSALLAGVAGLLPARRAARLPAREAVVTA
jgi:macrolide transport system ATP-binding/permease protein